MALTKARHVMELMRWNKPTGTVLALTPSLWSMSMMTPSTCLYPDLKTAAIFTAGAIIARGMGCTVNDILDRKIDRKVTRTMNRPIASGALSLKEGIACLAVQSTAGLYVLCLNNPSVIKLGLFSGLLISSYPLFKRFTHWPQAMLAVTMNWGVLMGYAQINGSICWDDIPFVLPLYLGSICWTMYYDTIYAHQDKFDDSFIGVKSSALILNDRSKAFLRMMIGGMGASLATAGALTGQMWPYFTAVGISVLYLHRQLYEINLDRPQECWNAFNRQKYIGLLILVGFISSGALKYREHRSRLESLLSTDKASDSIAVKR